MLGHLGNYFKGLRTNKGWKVCEAACTENTKSVPNLLRRIFFFHPKTAQGLGRMEFSLILVS